MNLVTLALSELWYYIIEPNSVMPLWLNGHCTCHQTGTSLVRLQPGTFVSCLRLHCPLIQLGEKMSGVVSYLKDNTVYLYILHH